MREKREKTEEEGGGTILQTTHPPLGKTKCSLAMISSFTFLCKACVFLTYFDPSKLCIILRIIQVNTLISNDVCILLSVALS